MKIKQTEKDFQKQFIQLAQLGGWRVAHFRPAQTQTGRWVTPVQGDGKGFPDNLLIRDRRLLVAELKVGRNVATPEQEAWLAAFERAHVDAFLWTPDNWTEIEATLR